MLRNFDVQHFLSNFWQKAPCLIKNALREPPNFVTPDELAGLALDEEVESRIISNINGNWQLEHGPFEAEYFAELPEENWTLLIQTLDHWMPEVRPFIDLFNFIPRWRYDDLMVSFATNGGGVGPHFDNYDVFLVQSSGERRWRVGAKGDTNNQQTMINGLRHLDEFESIIDVIMQPGDILYIPPDTPHWGQSIGESMGYSVGFRAPQTRDLLALLLNHLEDNGTESFFEDPYRDQANYSSKIEPQLISWAQKEIRKLSENQSLIEDLLSNYLSRAKIEEFDGDDEKPFEFKELDIENVAIRLSESAHANWFEKADFITLNINGDSCQCDLTLLPFIKKLLNGQSVEIKGLEQQFQKFDFFNSLTRLINKGLILVIK